MQRLQPHQIYAAGDLSDPHGTHRTCLSAVLQASKRVEQEPWYAVCEVWLYRGAWQEWNPHQIDMAVPLSPQELLRRGESVVPGFPAVAGGGDAEFTPAADGTSSGRRLALARWIVDPGNPLTPRAMANRLWQFHFGRPLALTPNDFGRFGLPPTHPQLLDWLAAEFLSRGYRLKAMHRLIMTSAAYRMSSAPNPEASAVDPENQCFWRFDVRRLTGEEIRDSILMANGTLNLEMGGPGVFPEMPAEVLATASRPDQAWGRSSPEEAARRSVYIHVKRSLLTPLLVSFDLAETDASCPVRFETTQPTQALTLLNSDFANRQAELFAVRLKREAAQLRDRIALGLRLVTCRPAQDDEIERGLQLCSELQEREGLSADRALDYYCLLLFNLNEFVFLD